MLKRKAWDQIEAWSQRSSKKALLIKGARQIGKTTLVRKFAKDRYECFAELNFLSDSRASEIFSGDLDADTLIRNLTAYLKQPLIPGKTLVLLDEIQECPNARTAIKFLVEDGRFDYIETGSLLGVKTREVASYPVGFEEHLDMFPLDFEEFCWANGVQEETIDYLHECFVDRKPVGGIVHKTMLDLLSTYLVVGGMPEVVQEYVNNHDIARVIELQRSLIELYRLDIAKYAEPSIKVKIKSIFDAIPSQLDEKNRRFVIADLSKNARSARYESSFLWLTDAGIALPCYNVTAPVAPLEVNSKHSLMKLFMGDIGLLCAASMNKVQFELLKGSFDANLGSIMENAVGQELRSHGFSLYYFNTKCVGEVDFLVQDGSKVMAIEVKSGNDWKSHKALNNLMNVDEWGIDKAVVLCKGDIEVDGNITYLPLYMAMFLRPEPIPSTMHYELDLSALVGVHGK